MIESGTLYEQLTKDHEEEQYRQDLYWVLEIESLGRAHLAKAIEMPEVSAYSDMLVAAGTDLMKVVLRLPTDVNVEAQVAQLILNQTACKAALYMLARNGSVGELKVCSTWLFTDFKVVKMKLQSFDRDRPAGMVELLMCCSFRDVKII